MKKSLIILFLIFLTVVPLTGCTKVLNYYEDKLYSEKTVLGDQDVSAKTSNVLTRENAIKKALDVFDKGLNIKIDRTQFTENIRLVRNGEVGSLQWQINWVKDSGKMFYECILDSSTGNIVRLQWFNNSNLNQDTTAKLSNLEITNLLNPLLKQLEIDVNDYRITPQSSNDLNNYRDIILYNNKNHTKEYRVTIDSVNKIVVSFEKLDKQFQ